MDIRMYDCGFGDCFKLTDDNNNALYVDFGIHMNSKAYNITLRYDQIINDMPDKCDFLLTHYHFDHYSGAVYMAKMLKAGKIKKRFRDVYIPDVWNIDGSVEVVYLLLLRGLITECVLTNNISLIDFLIAICDSSGTIHFVKRGNDIQDSYIALWPDENHANKKAHKLFEDLRNKISSEDRIYGIIFEELNSISERLCKQVIALGNTYGADSRAVILAELEALRNEYNELYHRADFNKNIKEQLFKYGLFKCGNDISIVLQNKMRCDRNILFTGDLKAKAAWNFIENNSDGNIPLYDKYDVIKIPHHGTDGYYHSFTAKCYDKTTLLIPNGQVSLRSWYISPKYSNDANITNSSVICSDNKACNAAAPFCTCLRCRLANMIHYYIDL